MKPICPKHWRPTSRLVKAVADYERIKKDFAEFDGDRRGIVAALVGAQSRIVQALELNPEGDEDSDRDYVLVEACAKLIAREVEHSLKPQEPPHD